MDMVCALPGFDSLSWPTVAFVLTVIGGAALVHGSLGLGFPMLATPLLAMVSDVRCAMLALLVPTVLINLINIADGGNWRHSIGRYWPLAVYGSLGSALGTRLLIGTHPEPYRLLLAAAILFYLNSQRLGLNLAWTHRRPQLAMALFGIAAGLLGGTVNVMMPPLVIFALEMRLAPTATVQVFNLCFLVGKVTQAIVFARAGYLTGSLLGATVPLALVACAALLAGIRLRRRIAPETYRRSLRKVLWGLSLLLVVQYGVQASGLWGG